MQLRYMINVLVDGKPHVIEMSESLYKKLGGMLPAPPPDPEPVQPPRIVYQHVCADCGLETNLSNGPCPKCRSLRVVPQKIVAELFGDDWREAFTSSGAAGATPRTRTSSEAGA